MKKILLLLAILVPMVVSAMKIETDQLDEFTGERTVITSWEHVCSRYIHIRFRLQNGIEWLDFKFRNDDAIVIPVDGKLMFKATNDSIVTFNTMAMYHGGKGEGSVGMMGSGMWGISASYKGNLSWFDSNIAKLLRVYATDVYYDRKLSENDGKKLCNLYDLFSKTLNNTSGKSPFADYTIQFVKRSKKSSSWDVEKEDYYPNLSSEELEKITTEWKSKSDDRYIYDCRIKKAKSK